MAAPPPPPLTLRSRLLFKKWGPAWEDGFQPPLVGGKALGSQCRYPGSMAEERVTGLVPTCKASASTWCWKRGTSAWRPRQPPGPGPASASNPRPRERLASSAGLSVGELAPRAPAAPASVDPSLQDLAGTRGRAAGGALLDSSRQIQQLPLTLRGHCKGTSVCQADPRPDCCKAQRGDSSEDPELLPGDPPSQEGPIASLRAPPAHCPSPLMPWSLTPGPPCRTEALPAVLFDRPGGESSQCVHTEAVTAQRVAELRGRQAGPSRAPGSPSFLIRRSSRQSSPLPGVGAPRTSPTRPRVEWTSPDPDTAGIGPRGSSTLFSQLWPVRQSVAPGAEDRDSNRRLGKGTSLCLGPPDVHTQAKY
ncbi:unnamed protein product [Rangifer tarandus platyrhynchus]|uniref:Uncharacterized protein n=1 Tax=Rangifer tarandus platyrhynchus TaxID=3082113 RepID=A0ABN8XUB6_RANTA|nr:unnamed protein product [Rangifer tarandus platyrhynchus]